MSITFPNHWEPVSPNIDPEEWVEDDEEQWTTKLYESLRNALAITVKYAEARRFLQWHCITEN